LLSLAQGHSLNKQQKLIQDKAYELGLPFWGLTLAAICKVESSYGINMKHSGTDYGWFGLSREVLIDYIINIVRFTTPIKVEWWLKEYTYQVSSNFDISAEVALWHWERCWKWAGELGYTRTHRWFIAHRIWNGGKRGWRKSSTKIHSWRINEEIKILRSKGFVG